MKVKGKELILKIVSLVATVLTFVGLAFKFITTSSSSKLGGGDVELTRADWKDAIKLYKEPIMKDYNSIATFWQIARVFMIISLIVIAILAVITIIQFFFNHKYLALAKTIVSIVALVCVIVFFATLVIGNIMLANKGSNEIVSTTVLPHVGPCFMFVFGAIASVAALLDKKKA